MSEVNAADFELILVDPKEALCEAWGVAFEKSSRVSIVRGRFEALPEFLALSLLAFSLFLLLVPSPLSFHPSSLNSRYTNLTHTFLTCV
jgi:hypothetical protein